MGLFPEGKIGISVDTLGFDVVGHEHFSLNPIILGELGQEKTPARRNTTGADVERREEGQNLLIQRCFSLQLL